MAKQKIDALVKGGHATPAPPLGPSLSQMKVNVAKVVEEINKKTKSFDGMDVPVKIIVDDVTKTFTVTVGTPPVSAMLKKEMGVGKLATVAEDKTRISPGNISFEKIVEITHGKQDGMTGSFKAKVKQVVGTCVSGGVSIDGKPAKQVMKEIENGLYDHQIEKARQ